MIDDRPNASPAPVPKELDSPEDREEELSPTLAAALNAVSAYAEEECQHRAAKTERAREKAAKRSDSPGPDRKRHKRPPLLH